MPPESFRKLVIIGGIILALFLLSLAMQGTQSIIGSVFRFLILVPVILLSLTLHELAHALMADFLGDPTPRNMGRITLNPLRHLDPLGALMLFFTGFGWAKPVMVEARNFRIPGRAMAVVAIVGPLSNFLQAVFGILLMKGLAALITSYSLSPLVIALAQTTIELYIIINLGLAFFNLLPVPPLDGSRILSYLLPAKYSLKFRAFADIAPFILLILFAIGGLGILLSPLINNAYNFLNSMAGNPAQEIKIFLMQFS
jgi:Zn-dependent protease